MATSFAAPDAASLPALVAALRAEVLCLQTALGTLHGSDVVALRRLCASLAQHVAALAAELDGLRSRAAGIEASVFDPPFVAAEAARAAAAVAAATAARALLNREPSAPFWLRAAPPLAAAAFILLRLGVAVGMRARGLSARNALRRARLVEQARTLEERVRIMQSLCRGPFGGGAPAPAPGVPEGGGFGAAAVATVGTPVEEGGASAAVAFAAAAAAFASTPGAGS